MDKYISQEVLTDDKMRQVFGASYSNVVSFNFDARRWNKRKYQGYPILDQFLDTNNAQLMKDVFDKHSCVHGYELAAVASRAVDGVLAGAVVVRDLRDGKIIKRPSEWFVVQTILDRQALANCIVSIFMHRFLYDAEFRKSVLLSAIKVR